ncbi:zonadhesin-like [Phlebotomus argentipes]|uniref:zonadhesin-like n=1 Tax=Phlebotomus argentipes TaxID=94469 RepID=UPI002893436A|nr:zonadhesin-like [Phlebotomus argentipes]
MNWCCVKIFLVSCAVALCAAQEESSEHDQLEYPYERQYKEYYHGTYHEYDESSEDDDTRKHHYHNKNPNKGSHHYVLTTTPKPKPKPKPTTEGPVPLPQGKPKSCPRYEEYHDCGSPCQVECANLGKVCNIQNVRCSDGCYCIPGYARTSPNGPCVPQFKCPNPYCASNEVWLNCYQAPACDRDCSSLSKPCLTVGSSCNAGCFCRLGHARNSQTGECVPIKQCPSEAPVKVPMKPTPTAPTKAPPKVPLATCGKNEQFKPCGYRCTENCDADYCLYDKSPCAKGCFCKPGYARVDNKCVPRDTCPVTCPKNERYLDCGNTCMESCYKNSAKCQACERSGCFCVEGYSRINGVCVPDSKCPLICPLGEVYLECGSACQDDCDQSQGCTEQCVTGCFCKPGYARVKGTCVPRKVCKKCPKFEEYLDCGNACLESCYKDVARCVPCDREGCFCIEGYARINGVCRPEGQCPNKQCPPNEAYNSCGSACQDNCDLSQPCTDECVAGCFCEPEFARVDGTCVPRGECPVECPENEHFDACGNNCIDSCDRDLLDCSDNCYPGCYCDEGFARIAGKCVPRKKCDKCPLNEEFLKCGNGCQDLCDPSAVTCTSECVKGCFCQEKFSRINGLCVPRSNCFDCASGEQYYECSNSCLELCNANAILCPAECSEGCYCAPGFSRIKGQCLPSELCQKCGKNEQFFECGSRCAEKCGINACPVDGDCEPGCYCKAGYRRLGDKCVPESKCPPPECPNENEVYSECGNNCTDLCEDPSRICTLECYPGCFCAEGYSRAEDGSPCIPDDQCPPVCTGKNEQYYECGNECTDSCPSPDLACTLECTSGCFCKPDFARLKAGGPCLPAWKCPDPCPNPNEEWNTCGNNCTELCPRPGRACEKNCWPGCFCEKGFYRDRYGGECIPEEDCPPPPVCKRNEEVSDCGNSCDDYCPGATFECPIDCQIGCYCAEGFKRLTPGGPCLPEKKCPPPTCTGANEEYTKCGSSCREQCPSDDALCPDDCTAGCFCKEGFSRILGVCVPTKKCAVSCSLPNEAFTKCGSYCREQCPQVDWICPDDCTAGCFCAEGFSRVDGACVPNDQCPPICNDPNEEYTTCGNTCNEQCPIEGVACTEECKTGCFCKAGYSRNNSVCIETSQCPGQCADPNEIYTTCGNSCTEKCYALICPANCETGCYCRPGYSRVQGICVPKKECPKCGKNEEYTYCGSGCTDPCESRGIDCKDACREGCFCKDNFSRVTPESKCVPDSKCPHTCSAANERYSDCGNRCKEQCNGESCPEVCESGCFCKAGFSRLNGKCVPNKKCPPKCKDPNEEFTTCGNTCAEECGGEDNPCPLVCQVGCFCKAGYSRNITECIPTDQCPKECADPNEIFTTCGNTCLEQCGADVCPEICETGCYCRPGYSRVQGVCVPTSTCPTCAENEVYTYCGSACTDPCQTRGQICYDACKEGCFCQDGYSRVEPGSPCVPDSECSSTR